MSITIQCDFEDGNCSKLFDRFSITADSDFQRQYLKYAGWSYNDDFTKHYCPKHTVKPTAAVPEPEFVDMEIKEITGSLVAWDKTNRCPIRLYACLSEPNFAGFYFNYADEWKRIVCDFVADKIEQHYTVIARFRKD